MPVLRFCAAVCLAATLVALAPPARATRPADVARHRPPSATPPMRFEPNLGQTDARVRFTARTREGALFLTDREAVLRERRGGVVRVAPVGTREGVRATGLDRLPGATNYLRGGRDRWRAGVPGFARVRYEGVYPGVDLIYYGAGGHLEYDFALAAGADPAPIRLRVDGAERIDVDASGDLVLRTASGGEIRHRAPRCYQPAHGERRTVAGRYVLAGDREVAFALGAYDPSLPVVIDPAIAFATYLGGGDIDDGGDIAVDASGAVYVVGTTTSADFPVVGALQGQIADTLAGDVFVAKLAPDGASLVYSTYLGGGGADSGGAIAVDETGAAYVAGLTLSDDFPTASPFQAQLRGVSDGFLAKLAPDGASLVFSTFFGGGGEEQLSDIGVRPDHTIVAGGRTTSSDLPLASASQSHYGGGLSDGFVAIFAATGAGLVESTYLGGNGADEVNSVVLGADGSAYASGATDATNFAVCPGAGPEDGVHGFVTRVAPDPATSVAIGCDGRSIVKYVASTEQPGFKTRGGGFEIRTLTGGGTGSLDVRAVTLGADLGVVREKAFGGSGEDYPDAVVAGPGGVLYVVGDTDSPDLPTVGPVQGTLGGNLDVFVALLAPGTDEVTFATYIGGSDVEFPSAVATDADGNIYVTGVTYSTDFPTSDGALQSSLAGFSDAFVVKIAPDRAPDPDFSLSVDPTVLFVKQNETGSVDLHVGRVGGLDGSVTVTAPDTKAIKVKLQPRSASTTGELVTINYKIKKKAVLGTHQLVFTGRDASGRSRTTTLEMTIQ